MNTVSIFNSGRSLTLRVFTCVPDPDAPPTPLVKSPDVALAGNGRITEVDADFWAAWSEQNAENSLLTTHTLFVVTNCEVTPWPQHP